MASKEKERKESSWIRKKYFQVTVKIKVYQTVAAVVHRKSTVFENRPKLNKTQHLMNTQGQVDFIFFQK